MASFFPPSGPSDSAGPVQDDDDESVLDFVFDGTFRASPFERRGGRDRVEALRRQIDELMMGRGDPNTLKGLITSMTASVAQAVGHFQSTAQRLPQRADFCQRNIEAYANAFEALHYMKRWFDNPANRDFLTQGMVALEQAVNVVDNLLGEESAGPG